MQHITSLRSVVPWMGGKSRLASSIVSLFPSHESYDTYVELFCGSCSVLLQKPRYTHNEIINDANEWLVNFWMTMRDYAEELEERLSSLPYSRAIFEKYRDSLFRGGTFNNVELATRWFYVLYTSYGRQVTPTVAWGSGIPGSGDNKLSTRCRTPAHSFRQALAIFTQLQERLGDVLIEGRDFEPVFTQYDSPHTLFYVDPPYVGYEHYYQPRKKRKQNAAGSAQDLHERLAQCLNSTQAKVVLSYYEHPLITELYPPEKWRCVTFDVAKHTSRQAVKDHASETVLLNFSASQVELWDVSSQTVVA
jgi:DNA adenine methylase